MGRAVKNPDEQRGSWSSWSEFLFAILGSLVGYGNVWRFPYVCFRNGGGAFLFPFLIFIFVCGIPLVFLETSYSQYSNYGPGRVWEICPLFKGIGFCMIIVVFIVAIYYTMIMAWTLYYLVNSFKSPIPWSTCENAWNTVNCTVTMKDSPSHATNASFPWSNASDTNTNITLVSSTEEFWFNNALDISSSIHQSGMMRWELVVCLLASWAVTCLCLIKGIQSLGKVAYVAASMPYIILLSFLIRGCMLPGAMDGLYYFIVPRWEILAKISVWRDAATQTFYSIGIAMGTLLTLSSYSKFHNNCYRDAMILPILDTLTSVFAGVVIFAYLGYTARVTGKDIDQVVAQGPGLAFIVYPAAIATLPLPQVWSVLFFLMLFAMGLDSQFVHVEVLTTAVLDICPQFISKKLLVTIGICTGGFVLGLPMTTQAGVYMLNLLDWYIASVALLLTAFMEIFVLAWIYGVDRLFSDIEKMIGYRPHRIIKFSWRYSTPIITLFLLISGFVYFEAISAKQTGFDTSSDILGLVIAIIPVSAMPVLAVLELTKRHGPLTKRIKDALQPTALWRPALYNQVESDGHQEVDLEL